MGIFFFFSSLTEITFEIWRVTFLTSFYHHEIDFRFKNFLTITWLAKPLIQGKVKQVAYMR